MKHAPSGFKPATQNPARYFRLLRSLNVFILRGVNIRYNIHDHNVTLMQKCAILQMNTAIGDRQVINTIVTN